MMQSSTMREMLKSAAIAIGLEPLYVVMGSLRGQGIQSRTQSGVEIWWSPLERASDAEMILCALRPAVSWGSSCLRVEGSAGVVSYSRVPDTPADWSRAYRTALVKYAETQYHINTNKESK